MWGGDAVCSAEVSVPDGRGGVHVLFDWGTSVIVEGGREGAQPPVRPPAALPPGGAGAQDGGLGYMHCAGPAGPCNISETPVAHWNAGKASEPIFPGYEVTYGGTLLKRKHDWLVLAAMSRKANTGGIWALVAMTSPGPDPDPATGPAYSAPRLLLYPESPRWHPGTCEFYPCFATQGFAYCACSSLQANRGYQVRPSQPPCAPCPLRHRRVAQSSFSRVQPGPCAACTGRWILRPR